MSPGHAAPRRRGRAVSAQCKRIYVNATDCALVVYFLSSAINIFRSLFKIHINAMRRARAQ